MQKLKDKVVKSRYGALVRRHRAETCELVREACVGRTVTELAKLLDQTNDWVQEHLHGAGALEGLGADADDVDITRDGVRSLVRGFKDEPDKDIVDEYELEGHVPSVAKTLAKAQQATSDAIDSGKVKVTAPKPGKQTTRKKLEYTEHKLDFGAQLEKHCARIEAAAEFLDEAKVPDLRRAFTRDQVAPVYAKFMEQIERLENFHPTFAEKVQTALS